LTLAVLLAALLPAPAEAARPLSLGIFDSWSRAKGPISGETLLGEADSAGAALALNSVSWRSVAPTSPSASFDAADPADPEYSWGGIDDFVRDADAQELEIIMLISSAPDWAEGAGRPPGAAVGTWKPDPAELADFATAIATRYSGGFVDPASESSEPLPWVGYYQAWAEANLSTRLSPQWSGAENRRGEAKPRSPKIYRDMLNAFYPAIKHVDRSMSVIGSGTAPYGDEPGGRRMRPLDFWGEVLCLRGSDLTPGACPVKARFDIFAHHPINTSGRPSLAPVDPRDISSANLGVLVDALRKAERAKRAQPPGSHPVWVTEFWYRSNPPEGKLGLAPRKHGRYVAESLYLFWRAGAEVAVNLLVRDTELNLDSVTDPAGSGLYYADGRGKPALLNFRFPFVADRLHESAVRLWGKAPGPGAVSIEARGDDGEWERIARLRAGANGIFTGRRRIAGSATLRAVLRADASPTWRLPG